MAKRVSLSRVVMLFFITVALTLAFIAVTPYLPEKIWPQNAVVRRVKLASDFIAAHKPTIRSEQRFEDVQLAAFKGHGGCLLVYGTVPSETDRSELEQMIHAAQPPVEVMFQVRADGP